MKFLKLIVGIATSALFLTACGSKDKESIKEEISSNRAMKSSDDIEKSMIGEFEGSKKHIVSGKVMFKDDKLMLRRFKTDKGPDLHIYLSKDGKIENAKELAKIDLEKSEQTFDLMGINHKEYKAVLIYCNKAHELFGSAEYN
ncbi:DM13 domain-containing protein [Enterococcus faecalis]|uniref:DM13 domain-containing protein n=1 Tax=Enterococcus faecalis TaxID=1351 RepID=UPI000459ACE2|nr:DM13 domain-containing protein [Enterococcus faecalis]KAJ85484.1 hypothetical protein P791_1252 [Enterococcus faecalis NY9]